MGTGFSRLSGLVFFDLALPYAYFFSKASRNSFLPFLFWIICTRACMPRSLMPWSSFFASFYSSGSSLTAPLVFLNNCVDLSSPFSILSSKKLMNLSTSALLLSGICSRMRLTSPLLVS